MQDGDLLHIPIKTLNKIVHNPQDKVIYYNNFSIFFFYQQMQI